jgi:hypothetical protein
MRFVFYHCRSVSDVRSNPDEEVNILPTAQGLPRQQTMRVSSCIKQFEVQLVSTTYKLF